MRERSWRIVLIGLAVSAISLALLPLLLITGAKIGRFIAVIALIGLLIGASIAFNGFIDRWRGGA